MATTSKLIKLWHDRMQPGLPLKKWARRQAEAGNYDKLMRDLAREWLAQKRKAA